MALSRGSPSSVEHAVALAELSRSENWSGLRDEGRRHALEAVTVAELTGVPLALAHAYLSLAHSRFGSEGTQEPIRRAIDAARESGNVAVLSLALVFRINLLHDEGRHEAAADAGLEALRHARAAGDLSRAAFIAGMAAKDLLTCGRLAEAGQLVREGLSLPGLSNSVAMARLSALVLAVRQGELARGSSPRPTCTSNEPGS